jgi:hypothetical protein
MVETHLKTQEDIEREKERVREIMRKVLEGFNINTIFSKS